MGKAKNEKMDFDFIMVKMCFNELKANLYDI